MTVREMLERMDSREIAEWQAYDLVTGRRKLKIEKSEDEINAGLLEYFRGYRAP